ncbi:MAG: CopD family protein [Burkholderiaceae bacterium]
MRIYTLMLFLHLLGVVIWVGGMFLMHFAVRPTAVAVLEPPQRLPLLAGVLGRFFAWVVAAVLVVLASGLAMILGGGGFRGAHASVHWMFAIGLVMIAIFGYIRWVPYPALRAAVAARQWPEAAARLDVIRKLVAVNLALGIATIAVATLGRAFL